MRCFIPKISSPDIMEKESIISISSFLSTKQMKPMVISFSETACLRSTTISCRYIRAEWDWYSISSVTPLVLILSTRDFLRLWDETLSQMLITAELMKIKRNICSPRLTQILISDLPLLCLMLIILSSLTIPADMRLVTCILSTPAVWYAMYLSTVLSTESVVMSL